MATATALNPSARLSESEARDIVRDAYHEMGHAIGACVAGYKLISMQLRPLGSEIVRGHVRCQAPHPTDPQGMAEAKLRRAILTACGPAAESRWLGSDAPIVSFFDDVLGLFFGQSLAAIVNPDPDVAQTYADLANLPPDTAVTVLSTAANIACRVIIDLWPAVADGAVILLAEWAAREG